MTVDGNYFSENNQKYHKFRNDLYGFLGMCDPHGVKPDDVYQKLNFRILLQLGFLKTKRTLKSDQQLMLSMKIFKFELKLNTVAEIMNSLYTL